MVTTEEGTIDVVAAVIAEETTTEEAETTTEEAETTTEEAEITTEVISMEEATIINTAAEKYRLFDAVIIFSLA